MRVRHGWSGEVNVNQWAKISVELEEDDLRRILTEAGLPGDHPVPVQTAFLLLEIEGERLVYLKLMMRHGYDPAAGKTKLDELAEQKAKVLSKLKAAQDE